MKRPICFHKHSQVQKDTQEIRSKEHFILSCRSLPVWLLTFATIGIVFAIYSNTFSGPFLFDDLQNILDNQHIRLTDLQPQALYDAAFNSPCPNRPVANLSLALNYFFHGYDVAGYHLVNILIHIMTGFMLFFLVRNTILISQRNISYPGVLEKIDPVYTAFFVMLVWLVHPLHTQSVTYIVQRMTSMAAMFYILSMLCYVKGRLGSGFIRWSLYTGCLVSALLAFATKEISATLPVFIFLYEWFFFQDLNGDWLKKRILVILFAAAVVMALAFLYLDLNLWGKITSGYIHREFTLEQRVLTEFRVILFYLALLISPKPSMLALDHDFPLSYSFVHPVSTLVSFGVLVFLFVMAIYTARKQRLISFCILWFLGNLAIESSVIGLELVFEHRTYLPSMFVIFIFVVLVFRFIHLKWAAVFILCAIVGIFSVWTYQRNAVWADEVGFLRDVVAKAPNKARPHNNLGLVLLEQGKIDEATDHLRRALELSPSVFNLYKNLAQALMIKGNYEEALDYYKQGLTLAAGKDGEKEFHLGIGNALDKIGKPQEAIEQYKQALAIDPEYEAAYNQLGKVLVQRGNLDEALLNFSYAVQVNTSYAEAHNNMANVYVQQGRDLDAIDHYGKALRINPDYADAHYNLGLLFTRRGELNKAIEQFQEVLRIEPDHADALKNLDVTIEHGQRIRDAIEKIRHAVKDNPQDPKLFFQLGELRRMEGSFTEAVKNYEKALSILPEFPQALRQAAVVYSLAGDKDKAVSYLKKAVELNPDDPGGYYNIACMYSLAGNVDESVSWLKKAVEKGFDDWELMSKDTDLNNIRKTEDFEKLLQERRDK